ncbi:MAG TPA: PfkB family carbohydrate kinase [Candidatus Limnocylindrales bacterium]|nr:PfkB family carbohydrate kinase [Candidatus Limnocylindrales bacterium]
MIVIGSPLHVVTEAGPRAGGFAVAVARAAAAVGARVEIVGKVGEDPAGDAVLLDLAAYGIGHVAVLRDPGRPTGIEVPPAEPESAPFDEPGEAAAGRDGVGGVVGAPPHGQPTLDAADIGLALRYIPEYRVIVIAEPLAPDALEAAAAAARWAGAALVVIIGAGEAPPTALGPEATVLEAQVDDPDGTFARVVGEYAARLERGEPPAEAFAAASSGTGWTAATDA